MAAGSTPATVEDVSDGVVERSEGDYGTLLLEPAPPRPRRVGPPWYEQQWVWPTAVGAFLVVSVVIYWVGTWFAATPQRDAIVLPPLKQASPVRFAIPPVARPVTPPVKPPPGLVPERGAAPVDARRAVAPPPPEQLRGAVPVPAPAAPPLDTDRAAPVVPPLPVREVSPPAVQLPDRVRPVPSDPVAPPDESAAAAATPAAGDLSVRYRRAVARHNWRVDEYNALAADMHRDGAWGDPESFAELHRQLEQARLAVERSRVQAEKLRGQVDAARLRRRRGP